MLILSESVINTHIADHTSTWRWSVTQLPSLTLTESRWTLTKFSNPTPDNPLYSPSEDILHTLSFRINYTPLI